MPASLGFLASEAPGFALRGSQIKIITEPSAFFAELCQRASSAQRRITLSALYLGTGAKEHQLVDAIHENVRAREGLQVRFLLDYFRGNRIAGGQSSCTMLQKLKATRQDTCRIALYHTPVLRGFKKRILPQRYNETYGLQHTKLYIFDDSVIISGANLSNDYFTNRQDRYVLIKDCPRLANYLDDIVDTISRFSFQMNAQGEFELRPDWRVHPSDGDYSEYVKGVQDTMGTFMAKAQERNQLDQDFQEDPKVDTWVFPTMQMGIFGIDQDQKVTSKLLESGVAGSSFKFGTGYFNPTPEYLDTILHQSQAEYKILMAHPWANGFFGARFPAGGIPDAYTLITKQFFERIRNNNYLKRIQLFEYLRDGWTFHGKGLWHYLPGQNLPSLTMIGSPNFGYRSVEKDLEAQITIVTRNERLRRDLDEEQKRLFDASIQVSDGTFQEPKRRIPYWVRFVVWSARDFF
eukprot:maker-scaffold38_size502422-snap-gene-2.20 protein:Tk05869 transcript:maker-scaffold38_size502422-snap-gene-2.20-mRNA-1 annotation:"GI22216"